MLGAGSSLDSINRVQQNRKLLLSERKKARTFRRNAKAYRRILEKNSIKYRDARPDELLAARRSVKRLRTYHRIRVIILLAILAASISFALWLALNPRT